MALKHSDLQNASICDLVVLFFEDAAIENIQQAQPQTVFDWKFWERQREIQR